MTEAEERDEIIHNARAAYCAGQITCEQLNDVYFIQARDEAEKRVLSKYPEAKGQTK